MRKLWFYLLAIILVGGTAAAIFAAVKNSKSHDDNSSAGRTASPAKKPEAKRACLIFTLADAKQLLGDTAKGGVNPIYDNPQGDLAVTSCTYTQDQGANAPVSSRQSATLLVRVPLSDGAIASNQSQFGAVKPLDVQDVDGYGDKAYWDSSHGQLNILKDNTWYVLSYGPAAPAGRSLDQTKQMADEIVAKL